MKYSYMHQFIKESFLQGFYKLVQTSKNGLFRKISSDSVPTHEMTHEKKCAPWI